MLPIEGVEKVCDKMLAFLPTLDALPTTSLMCPATGDCPGIYDK